MHQQTAEMVGALVEERFWKLVDKSGDCWTWKASLTTHGYGQFVLPYHHHIGAHRFAYELENGPVPAGLVVCHRCDNPPCVNPAHLWVGTQGDNLRDMHGKGRGNTDSWPLAVEASRTADRPHGEKHHNAHMTAEKIRALRKMRQDGATYDAIALEFGIGKSLVAQIITRKTWKHVT
jgi:hypothetical protein